MAACASASSGSSWRAAFTAAGPHAAIRAQSSEGITLGLNGSGMSMDADAYASASPA